MVKIDMDLSGVKIPKRVAGVKVPKRLRKQGNRLIEKANSPAGREAIAAVLTIAGAALAAKARAKAEKHARAHAEWAGEGPVGADAGKPPKPPKPPRPGEQPGVGGIDPAIDPAVQVGKAIEAGIGALQRFLGGREAK